MDGRYSAWKDEHEIITFSKITDNDTYPIMFDNDMGCMHLTMWNRNVVLYLSLYTFYKEQPSDSSYYVNMEIRKVSTESNRVILFKITDLVMDIGENINPIHDEWERDNIIMKEMVRLGYRLFKSGIIEHLKTFKNIVLKL